jgi:hypothetical protein
MRTPPPVVTNTPPATPTAIADGGEPAFNYQVVKEIVAPLVAEDGRTHYVTLSQDTNGVVRVRYSLFTFPSGFYTVYLHGGGSCTPKHQSTGPIWAQLPGVPVGPYPTGSSLELYFYNTTALSLTPGLRNSIYDEDGTSLAFSADASPENVAGRDVACAVLAAPPGVPMVGTGLSSGRDGRFRHLSLAAAVFLSGSFSLAGYVLRRRGAASGNS